MIAPAPKRQWITILKTLIRLAFCVALSNANRSPVNSSLPTAYPRTSRKTLLFALSLPFSITDTTSLGSSNKNTMSLVSLKQTVKCACGKVQLAIDSPSVLRLVCYCKDCRGYVNTLNEKAPDTSKPTTPLDDWGGVDWTSIYPSEISVTHGLEHMAVCKIREQSAIHRVYAKCCHTPLFNIGGAGCLLNSHLIDDDKKADVRFRIIGRQALKGPSGKPPISWSVPLSWFWTMPGRINKEKMQPTPIDISNPQVLEGFKQG